VTEEDAHPSGWREQKKLATRDAIGRAALRLALQVGPENVRVDDIAAEAGVSARTFNNYFSSREEAICALRTARSRQIADSLRARPVDEPLDEALIAALTDTGGLTGTGRPTEPDKATIRLAAATPAMRAEHLRSIIQIEMGLAEVIAERLGTDLSRDSAPRVIAAAFASALRVASEYWFRSDDDLPFTGFLRDALEQVAPVARCYRQNPSASDRPSVTPLLESPAC
jgi:AcrR family transcriptional regulator